MKKDILVGTLRTLVGLALLGYVIYLGVNHIDILPNQTWNYDLIVLSIVGLISLMMIYVGVIKPCFKKPRILQAFMGIFLILFAQYSGIIDNPSIHVYLGDILKVIGALALGLSFGKICTYDKCSDVKHQIESGEMEVIEIGDDTPKYNNKKNDKKEELEVIEV